MIKKEKSEQEEEFISHLKKQGGLNWKAYLVARNLTNYRIQTTPCYQQYLQQYLLKKDNNEK